MLELVACDYHRHMIARWLVTVALLSSMGCGSTANPRSCLDGSCTDPRYPFCDVEGSFSDLPGTCVAVTCTPGEVVQCRDAQDVLVCNGNGNNYDIEMCAHGCGAQGCHECATNAQCAAPMEICDTESKTCRGCQAGTDCESGICENAICVPPSAVVYASSTGITTGSCTRQEPCTLDRAAMIAVAAPTTPILKLEPGTYSSLLVIDTITPQPLRVLGEAGVVLTSTSGLRVQNGAHVELRFVEFLKDSTANSPQVTCGNAPTTDPISTVKLYDAKLSYRSGGGSIIQSNRCVLELQRADLGAGFASYALSLGSDTNAVLDQVHIHLIDGVNTGSTRINLSGRQRVFLTATNSVFEDVRFGLSTSDQAPPYSQHLLAFNTFVFTTSTGGSHAIECTPSVPTDYNWNARIENNIIYAPTMSSAIGGPHCTTNKNVVLNIAGGVGTNIVGDPQFVDAASGDFQVMSSSPAINAAVPASDLTTDHDFDGVARPQGAAHDIGAFERVP